MTATPSPASIHTSADDFMLRLRQRTPGELEFHQAVEEWYESIHRLLDRRPAYQRMKIAEQMVEPERVITFRVTWEDDQGAIHVNRGYRVQMNSALGPFKGGLRFHPSVNLSVLKFLAFEQVSKNALTRLPLGAGKGGADFDAKGRSDREVMRFCQAFMNELHRHIGPDTDVPAGDIGVGGREVGYMFGQYKKLQNQVHGAITGKGPDWGGSLLRPEATGYGLVYFASEMMRTLGQEISGKTCLVSGSGNVAQFTIEKLLQLGARPVTVSDSGGYIYDEAGIHADKLAFIKKLKNEERGRIQAYADVYPEAVYTARDPSLGYNPLWRHRADLALPCATQNELNGIDAQHLVDGGVVIVAEGANMPCTAEAIDIFHQHGIRYAPGKAANAGGVAVSGLEMAQNGSRLPWSAEEVDRRLYGIMCGIHQMCLETAEAHGEKGRYALGANIAAMERIAGAMLALGI